MRIRVLTPPWFADKVVTEDGWTEVPEGTTVSGALRAVRFPGILAGLCLTAVNGKKASLRTVLRDGDTISFFQMLAGG